MTGRLRTTLRLEARLLWRYHVVSAAVFVGAGYVLVLRQLPSTALTTAVQAVIAVDVGIIGFFFLAGMVLFERNERTDTALAVSPLRAGEYVAARVTVLTALAVALTAAVVLASGARPAWPALVAGVTLLSALVLLVGCITVARADSIVGYLILVQVPLAPLFLPLVLLAGIDHPALYVLPTTGPVLLVRGAFLGIDAARALYALVYPLVWILALAPAAGRATDRALRRG